MTTHETIRRKIHAFVDLNGHNPVALYLGDSQYRDLLEQRAPT